MKTAIDIRSAMSLWCKGQFNFRASFYTGRGVNLGDLNSRYLEMIYQGLKAEVGQEEATNFVRFVNNLRDLIASGFIQAFEYFWGSGCQEVNVSAEPGLGNQMSSRGDNRFAEGFAMIAMALGGGLQSPKEIESQSVSVKRDFIHAHRAEI